MSFITQLGFDAGRSLAVFGIDATQIARIGAREKEVLAYSGIGWTIQQYAAFHIACAFLAGLAYSVAFILLAVVFELNLWFLALCLPCALFGFIAAKFHVAGIARSRERCVEANLLDALRHFGSALKSGRGLVPALSEVGRGSYGVVSELVSEALSVVNEGSGVEAAFREAGEKTPSTAFKSFAASIAHASFTGVDLSRVVLQFARELEVSRRGALAVYSNECNKLSTVAVVLTGVLPGMLVFALVEGGFVFGFKVPVEFFLVSFLLVFPLAKYSIQAKLALSSPGA